MRKREQPVVTDDEHWLFFDEGSSVSLHILLSLDRQEYQILSYLYEHRGRVVRQSEMFAHIWGNRPYCDQPSTRIMAVKMSSLRAKLRKFGIVIETIFNIGWKLAF